MVKDRRGNFGSNGKSIAQHNRETEHTSSQTRWVVGEAEVQQMIASGGLETVSPNLYHATSLFVQAKRDVDAAMMMAESNSKRAYEALYESFRGSIAGLLAKQGLAVTRDGGHVAYGDVLYHQTGGNSHVADLFHEMRQRRNDFQYPTEQTMEVQPEEVAERLEDVRATVEMVENMAMSEKVGPF